MLRRFIEWLEAGEKTEAELLDLCLHRIHAREPERNVGFGPVPIRK